MNQDDTIVAIVLGVVLVGVPVGVLIWIWSRSQEPSECGVLERDYRAAQSAGNVDAEGRAYGEGLIKGCSWALAIRDATLSRDTEERIRQSAAIATAAQEGRLEAMTCPQLEAFYYETIRADPTYTRVVVSQGRQKNCPWALALPRGGTV